MTHDDPMHSPHPSREARYVFGYLYRRGGSMRLVPLMRHLRLEPRDLVAAITDLAELYWITIVWQTTAVNPCVAVQEVPRSQALPGAPGCRDVESAGE